MDWHLAWQNLPTWQKSEPSAHMRALEVRASDRSHQALPSKHHYLWDPRNSNLLYATPIGFCQVIFAKPLEMRFNLTCQKKWRLGKTQLLPSDIWQTVGHALKLPNMCGEGGFLPSCHILPSRLPNCWRSVLSVFAKNQGCQLHLPNFWRCSQSRQHCLYHICSRIYNQYAGTFIYSIVPPASS